MGNLPQKPLLWGRLLSGNHSFFVKSEISPGMETAAHNYLYGVERVLQNKVYKRRAFDPDECIFLLCSTAASFFELG